MYLKFIMFIFWIIALGSFVTVLIKGLWEGNVNYIRISIIGVIVSGLTLTAIYKDY